MTVGNPHPVDAVHRLHDVSVMTEYEIHHAGGRYLAHDVELLA